jgi:hypothetical protein
MPSAFRSGTTFRIQPRRNVSDSGSALLRRIDRKFDPNRIVHANVNFRLLLHRYWRWPFIVLLVWNLPVLATLEEFIFRHGMSRWPTVTWQDVMLRSVGFGAFHALMS